MSRIGTSNSSEKTAIAPFLRRFFKGCLLNKQLGKSCRSVRHPRALLTQQPNRASGSRSTTRTVLRLENSRENPGRIYSCVDASGQITMTTWKREEKQTKVWARWRYTTWYTLSSCFWFVKIAKVIVCGTINVVKIRNSMMENMGWIVFTMDHQVSFDNFLDLDN